MNITPCGKRVIYRVLEFEICSNEESSILLMIDTKYISLIIILTYENNMRAFVFILFVNLYALFLFVCPRFSPYRMSVLSGLRSFNLSLFE